MTDNTPTIKIKLDEGALPLTRAYPTDAGADLKTPRDVFVQAGGSTFVDTGVHVDIPDGYAGLLVSKSGLNVKHGILSSGLIDAQYTGSIGVKLYNHGNTGVRFTRGTKISQLVIFKVETPEFELVDELRDTERGEAGFGSTGR